MKQVKSKKIYWLALLAMVSLRAIAADTPNITEVDNLKAKEAILQDVQKQNLDKKPEVLAAVKLVQESVWIRAWEQHILKSNPISQAQREAAFKVYLNQLGSSEYRLYHISPADPEQAQILIQRLQSGLAWEKVELKAAANSDAKIVPSKTEWVNVAMIQPEFREAIKMLKPGQVYPTPVKSTAGWHVLGLIETRALKPPTIDQVKNAVDKLAERKLTEDKMLSLLTR